MHIALNWFHIDETGSYWHNGGTGGYSSYALFNPDKDFCGDCAEQYHGRPKFDYRQAGPAHCSTTERTGGGFACPVGACDQLAPRTSSFRSSGKQRFKSHESKTAKNGQVTKKLDRLRHFGICFRFAGQPPTNDLSTRVEFAVN